MNFNRALNRIVDRFRGRKRKLRVVLDTNIIISAITNRNSASAAILKSALERETIQLYLSEDTLREYEIILRPFGFALKDYGGREGFLEQVKSAAKMVEPKRKVHKIQADKSDNKFLECAEAADADYLITSDKHFNFKEFRGTRIVNSGEFIKTVR